MQHIVIAGGGAGGLELAVRLGNTLGKKQQAHITLIDAVSTHVWKPLLHQVAAGTLDSLADELEFFALARKHHFQFRLGRMDGLSRLRKEVFLAPTLDEGGAEVLPRQTVGYDTLVIALGSRSHDFGTPGVRAYCTMLDTPQAAEHFHRSLIQACLRAQVQAKAAGEGRFTVTIIGGGATGVELAAELHSATKLLSSYGLSHFDPGKDLRIVIVEAAPRLLSVLPERLANAASLELRKLGIAIHTGEKVVEVFPQGVQMASGAFIASDMMVWAAGIKAPDFLNHLDGLETNRINQLLVQRTLQSTRDPAVFALGDCAACPQGTGQAAVPPLAQAAHQQATLLAHSLARRLQGKALLEFTYKDYGTLVSLGDYSAIGSLMGVIAHGSVFVEGHIAKWMYWWLHKRHQIAVNGLLYTWLTTWAETINWARNPRIKLH